MDKPRVVLRLEQSQLDALERKLTPIGIQSNTTDLLAGQMIGEQRVLKLLRDGFTIST